MPELQGRMKDEVHGKRRHLTAEIESLEVLRNARNVEEARIAAMEKQRIQIETRNNFESIVAGVSDMTLLDGLVEHVTKSTEHKPPKAQKPSAKKASKNAAPKEEEITMEAEAEARLSQQREIAKLLNENTKLLLEGKYEVVADEPEEPEEEPGEEPMVEDSASQAGQAAPKEEAPADPPAEEEAPAVEERGIDPVLPAEPEPPTPSSVPVEPPLIYT